MATAAVVSVLVAVAVGVAIAVSDLDLGLVSAIPTATVCVFKGSSVHSFVSCTGFQAIVSAL